MANVRNLTPPVSRFKVTRVKSEQCVGSDSMDFLSWRRPNSHFGRNSQSFLDIWHLSRCFWCSIKPNDRENWTVLTAKTFSEKYSNLDEKYFFLVQNSKIWHTVLCFARRDQLFSESRTSRILLLNCTQEDTLVPWNLGQIDRADGRDRCAREKWKANQLHTKILTKFLLVAFCKIANLINDVAHQVL